jgi:hypothetical protein
MLKGHQQYMTIDVTAHRVLLQNDLLGARLSLYWLLGVSI